MLFLNHRDQTFGRDEAVAAGDELGDFCPIHAGNIQAQPDPSFGPHVGGLVELGGLGGDQRLVIAGQNFAGDADDAVAVMVVQVVSVGLAAYGKTRVLAQGLREAIWEGDCRSWRRAPDERRCHVPFSFIAALSFLRPRSRGRARRGPGTYRSSRARRPCGLPWMASRPRR